MEMLDIYDEFMNHMGSKDRETVHSKGLWHKTVHCWLYDKLGNIYFQIRRNSQKLYTTASGHVMEGETVKEAFHREVFEEIGANVDITNAEMIEINAWRLDKIKNDKPFIDRAFANVYMNLIDEEYNSFNFDENEVLGLVKVNAKECLDLFLGNVSKIKAHKYNLKGEEDIEVTGEDFLIQADELPIIKYGKILQRVIRATSK